MHGARPPILAARAVHRARRAHPRLRVADSIELNSEVIASAIRVLQVLKWHKLERRLLHDLSRIDLHANAGKAPESRAAECAQQASRSEEHTSELQSLMRISYAVFCLKKKNHTQKQ